MGRRGLGRRRRRATGAVIVEALAAVAAAYQVFAIVAAVRFRLRLCRKRPVLPPPALAAPVSILKPVRGLDSALEGAIASHSNLEGDYELLCGLRDLNDPAAQLLLREFPRARVIECRTQAPNAKAGVLIDLARHARHPILVVNDADIRVEPDYLV